MFTGIVYHTGRIERIEEAPEGGLRLTIEAPDVISNINIGSSVCTNGVCLTATQVGDGKFMTDVMPQTIELSTIGELKEGDLVNIETSLRVGDELGGHFMYGHVDGVAEVIDMQDDGNARLVTIRPPQKLMKYVALQGSLGINGVSLTVARLSEDSFTVSLIPETLELTTFKDLRVGDHVNLEVDMMMKYLDRLKGEG